MLEQPRAPALLDAARALLLSDLVPAMPADRRYAALMLANALAIAARDIGAEPALSEAEMRDLCRAIRDGAVDPGSSSREAARARLWSLARARCAVSAPKALARLPPA